MEGILCWHPHLEITTKLHKFLYIFWSHRAPTPTPRKFQSLLYGEYNNNNNNDNENDNDNDNDNNNNNALFI